MLHEDLENVFFIRRRLKMAQSQQKSYVDVIRRDLDFGMDDWVYLKILPMKGLMRFGKKSKLDPRYVYPYKILRHTGNVAHKLDLPDDLALVHPILNVSLFKKCVGDPIYIISLESLGIKESLSYEQVMVETYE